MLKRILRILKKHLRNLGTFMTESLYVTTTFTGKFRARGGEKSTTESVKVIHVVRLVFLSSPTWKFHHL